MPDALGAYRLSEPLLRFDYENSSASDSSPFKGLRDYGPYDAYERRRARRRRASTVVVCPTNRPTELSNARSALDGASLGKFGEVFTVGIDNWILIEPGSPEEEAERYRAAITNWLRDRKQDELPELAFILHDSKEFYRRRRVPGPYYASKAAFLRRAIPTQSIEFESVSPTNIHDFKRFYLANILSACYAKIGGTPWVVDAPTGRPEITLGIATTSIQTNNNQERFIGISTIFRENGAFEMWDMTPVHEDLDAYEKGLEKAIVAAIAAYESRLQPVRRITCHVSGKRAGHRETKAVRRALAQFVGRDFEATITHVSDDAALWLMDGDHATLRPESGLLTTLSGDCRQAVMHTAGRDTKGAGGLLLFRPLKLSIHQPKELDAWLEVYQHLYELRWMSWRGVGTPALPVSVDYPRRMANLLAYLYRYEGVDAHDVLSQFKREAWFL